MNSPLLSVCLITYNHHLFIKDAIEGILMQKVDFPIEIIIADDCSTDGTREILIECRNKHPNLVKLILQERNLGAAQNWLNLLKAPTGKYIAYFEGDDYWTDEYKLQKQVDFLEANEDYAICFHPVDVLNLKGELHNMDLSGNLPFKSGSSDIVDLALYGNYIHTPSVVFRNCIKKFPANFANSPMGDIYLYMLLAEKGNLKNLNESMAIYRSEVGIHSTQNLQIRIENTITTFNNIRESINNPIVRRILELRVAAYSLDLKSIELDKLKEQINHPAFLANKSKSINLLKALWIKFSNKYSLPTS